MATEVVPKIEPLEAAAFHQRAELLLGGSGCWVGLSLGTSSTLLASRFHRDSVPCETPVSFDSAVAVTAPRPVIFLIMLALKAAEYAIVVFSDSRPRLSEAPALRRRPVHAATTLTEGDCGSGYVIQASSAELIRSQLA